MKNGKETTNYKEMRGDNYRQEKLWLFDLTTEFITNKNATVASTVVDGT